LEEIESGQILIDGQEYKASSPEKAIKNEIGFLTEDRKNQGLVLNLDIADNFLMGFWESVKHLFIIDKQKTQNISEDYMKSLQIKARDISQEVATLSGGNQQKVVLGKWLIRESKIMLLDEPTKGIDVGAKAEFYKIIRSLADKGVTILLVSSELPEIMALCDRVLVMKDGDIVEQGNHEELLKAGGFYASLYYSQFENADASFAVNNFFIVSPLVIFCCYII